MTITAMPKIAVKPPPRVQRDQPSDLAPGGTPVPTLTAATQTGVQVETEFNEGTLRQIARHPTGGFGTFKAGEHRRSPLDVRLFASGKVAHTHYATAHNIFGQLRLTSADPAEAAALMKSLRSMPDDVLADYGARISAKMDDAVTAMREQEGVGTNAEVWGGRAGVALSLFLGVAAAVGYFAITRDTPGLDLWLRLVGSPAPVAISAMVAPQSWDYGVEKFRSLFRWLQGDDCDRKVVAALADLKLTMEHIGGELRDFAMAQNKQGGAS